jgi:hypothetical protein
MNAKMTSLVAGIALLAGVGIANAEERLTAASMDGVTAAGYYSPTFQFSKDVNTDVKHELWVDKDVYSTVHVVGNLADAEAVSECGAYYGGCLSETLTYTSVGAYGGTTSYSESLTAN